jgi:hypothetical protein
MASPKSPQEVGPYSPRRTADKPPPMAPLSVEAPPAGGAWHALLVGRTQEEIAAIIRQSGVKLLAAGGSVEPSTYQQFMMIEGERVMVNRWTKSTVAQFKHYAIVPDTLVPQYGTQETASPVKGKQCFPPFLPCSPLPTGNTGRAGGGGGGGRQIAHNRENFPGLRWRFFS